VVTVQCSYLYRNMCKTPGFDLRSGPLASDITHRSIIQAEPRCGMEMGVMHSKCKQILYK
jgi:hypothetical protein